MRLLLVLGAGASNDCWPEHVASNYQHLPLAKDLFSPMPDQDENLARFRLMGLASILRRRSKVDGDKFDIELELEKISDLANKLGDLNDLQKLFKARFYLHTLIKSLSEHTLTATSAHTVYVDLLQQIKKWIYQAPTARFVDIVTFNYDDLLEKAMENVFNYDWFGKSIYNPLGAYYGGKNVRIYKPHGSIN